MDELLTRYQLSCALPIALHLRTQKQIQQLREYQQVKEQLRASQVRGRMRMRRSGWATGRDEPRV